MRDSYLKRLQRDEERRDEPSTAPPPETAPEENLEETDRLLDNGVLPGIEKEAKKTKEGEWKASRRECMQ